MADFDKLDDVTSTDKDMPAPEMTTMSREDFEAGEIPDFKPIESREETDTNEDFDSVVSGFYDWYNMELYSAYLYRFLAAKCNLLGLDGAESFFIRKYDEETEHAEVVLNYILMRFDHDSPKFSPINEPPSLGTGEDIIGIFVSLFQTSLEHEKEVTAMITELKNLAEENGDYQDSAFLDSYLLEQVEEEDEFRTIIQRATLATDEGSILSFEHELQGSVAMKDNE